MDRRLFLKALPAVAAVFSTRLGEAAAPQDFEFIRAWERAQQARPRTLTSRGRIAPAGEPGPPMVIRGRLFQRDGRSPAPAVTVFAYHTDAQGYYDVRSNGPHSWRLKAWVATDAEGRFEFTTIRPAPYPGRATPAHVHVSIEGRDVPRRWVSDLVFEDDPLVSREVRAESAKARPFGGVRTVVERDGVQVVEFMIKITDQGTF